VNQASLFPKLVLASSNPGKLREFGQMLAPLGIDVLAQSALGISDADEPYPSFVENALAKARHASRLAKLPAMADDSGICVRTLDGQPGVHSARYADVGGAAGAADRASQDALNNEKLLALLRGKPDRAAHYACVIVLVRHAEDPELRRMLEGDVRMLLHHIITHNDAEGALLPRYQQLDLDAQP
jgi:XTP/dITP diphosphohydrolase